MKKIGVFVLWCCISSIYALPNKATIDFILNNKISGDSCPEILQQAHLTIDYNYNFEQAYGLAHLQKIQNVVLNERLYPLGISSVYAFMSDMAPKVIELANGSVTIYRILFHLHPDGQSRAFLMLGEEGDCVMGTNTVKVS